MNNVSTGAGGPLPDEFINHMKHTDLSCGAVKINCAIDKLPNFKCIPNDPSGKAGPQHFGTIHFETEMEQLEEGYRDAALGIPAKRPIVEMTIPSSLDSTISPPGKHVAQLFVQYAPYDLDPAHGDWADPAFVRNVWAVCVSCSLFCFVLLFFLSTFPDTPHLYPCAILVARAFGRAVVVVHRPRRLQTEYLVLLKIMRPALQTL